LRGLQVPKSKCFGFLIEVANPPAPRMSIFFCGIRRSNRDVDLDVVIDAWAEHLHRQRIANLEMIRTADSVLFFGGHDVSSKRPLTSPLLTAVFDGDPLVPARGSGFASAEAVATAVDSENWDALRTARGTYCGAVLDRHTSRLTLITDRLGVRPLYFAELGFGLVFAAAMWPFRCSALGLAVPDYRGRAEIAAFGFPLADRTTDARVKVLLAGEALSYGGDVVRRSRYWHWDRVRPHGIIGRDLVAAVDEKFLDSVRIRCAGSHAFSFLSGGMDSRLICSSLRRLGVTVDTLNFAPAGSLDLELGRLASVALGTRHREFPLGSSNFAVRLAGALAAWESEDSARSYVGRQVWAGDGGSVGLGHVYVSPTTVEVARKRGFDAAAARIQIENGLFLSRRILTRENENLADAPYQGIREELSGVGDAEPGRACHLFFLVNDQRRHLAAHFEACAVRNYELVLPFFDMELLSLVVGSNIDEFLLHRLYNRLMAVQTTGAQSVPWQAYPGHVPCPWPMPPGLRYQWDNWHPKNSDRAKQLETVRRSLGYVWHHDKMDWRTVRFGRFTAAALLVGLGVKSLVFHLGTAFPFANDAVWP
jgi:hypothetical protein